MAAACLLFDISDYCLLIVCEQLNNSSLPKSFRSTTLLGGGMPAMLQIEAFGGFHKPKPKRTSSASSARSNSWKNSLQRNSLSKGLRARSGAKLGIGASDKESVALVTDAKNRGRRSPEELRRGQGLAGFSAAADGARPGLLPSLRHLQKATH